MAGQSQHKNQEQKWEEFLHAELPICSTWRQNQPSMRERQDRGCQPIPRAGLHPMVDIFYVHCFITFFHKFSY